MKKSVSLELNKMSFVVEGETENELVENAKKAMLEALNEKFPALTYRISDADTLTLKDATPGRIVVTDDGKNGIIYSVKPNNKYPVRIVLTGGQHLNCIYECLKLSDAPFETIRPKRLDCQKPEWYEGETGYIKVKDEIKPVVISKRGKKNAELYIINEGRYLTLNEQQIVKFLKDNADEIA